MVITIYDREGNAKAEVNASDSSAQTLSLGGENVLSLSFVLHENKALEVDDYADFGGERYRVCEQYRPKEKSTLEWEYDVKLYGAEGSAGRILVTKRVDGEDSPMFTLTAPPAEHVAMIVNCLNEGVAEREKWSAGEVEGETNIVVDYFGKHCDEALKEIAEKAGTELWYAGRTINICKCEHEEVIALGYDKGLVSIDPVRADNVDFYTRLYPIGSSRNIDREKYGHTRLQLPGGVKYVEMNAEKYGRVDRLEEAAFAGIYPRRIGTVSSVRSETRNDGTGEPFTIYYFKDDGLNFDPNSYEIGGLVKRVSFQEGSELAGLGEDEEGTYYFEVNYDSSTGEFEIITTWPYGDGTQLPGGSLIPKTGDRYILWNIRMPDEYYTLAEEEFAAAVELYNRNHDMDLTVYKATTDHVWIEDEDVCLTIGQRVRLESWEYFPEKGYRESRITKITRKVNLPSQMDIEISDVVDRTAIEKITDSVSAVENQYNKVSGEVSAINGFSAGLGDILYPVNAAGKRVRWNSSGIVAICSAKDFYSLGGVSAKGISATAGTGGNGYGLMCEWPLKSPGKDTNDALGANLGYELYVGKADKTITNSLAVRITTLENAGYQKKTEAESLYQPKGNYLTDITKQMVEAVLTGTIKSHTHSFADLTGRPTTLAGYEITDAKISGGVITLGSNTITPLVAHQPIYSLTFQSGTFAAKTFNPKNAAATVNIPTTTSHIAEGTNLYFTDSRAVAALKGITDALNTAIGKKLDTTVFNSFKALFDSMFEKVNIGTSTAPVWAIRAKYGLYTNEFLSAKGADTTAGGGGGGIDESQLEDYLTDNRYAKQSWVLGKGYLTSAQLSSYLTNNGYATQSWVSANFNKYVLTKTAVEAVLTGNITTHTHSQYALASALGNKADKTQLADYVTLNTEQTISGTKKFTHALRFVNTAPNTAGWGGSADNGLTFWRGTESEAATDMKLGVYSGSAALDGVITSRYLYLGWGANAHSLSTSLAVCSSFIKYKNYDILHAGNYASILDGRYYTESEINAKLTNGSVTKVGTASVGNSIKPIYLNAGVPTASTSTVGGTTRPMWLNAGTMTACSATVGATNRPVYMSAGTITAVSSVGEAFLSWGGRNIAGGISPVDCAASSLHSANRMAFANTDGITIEYSRNGGTSWTDYGATAAQKTRLVSGLGTQFYIGGTSSGITTDYRLRITLDAYAMGMYTLVQKLLININTNGATGCKVLVERADMGTPTTFTTIDTYDISGWSGWNSIPLTNLYFGGNLKQTTNKRVLRLTFSISALSADAKYSSALYVADLLMIGTTYWQTPSTMAKTGHLYSYDESMNAVFPGKVTANGGFSGNLSGNATSASKLATPHNIWGRPFDGTGDVTGALTDVTNITMSGSLYMGPNTINSTSDYISLIKSSNAQKLLTGGLLVSNNYSDRTKIPAYGAYIKGNATVGSLTIGKATITWDEDNGGLKIDQGLYSTSYLSAKGADTTSGGGGGGIDESQLADYAKRDWVQSWVKSQGYYNSTQLSSYLTNNGYATQSWVSANFNKYVLTKAAVEAVLTGNITTHTHSQYLTSHQSLANYVTLNTAQTITAQKTFTKMVELRDASTDNAFASLPKLRFHIPSKHYSMFVLNTDGKLHLLNGGATSFDGGHMSIVASAFIKYGGSSSQFLKADGSVDGNSYSLTSHTHAFSSLTSKPTTISGYGIKDAMYFYDGTDYVAARFANPDLAALAHSKYIEFWSSGGFYNLMAGKFIKSGGTSTQFLKADGSVDSTVYAPNASLTSHINNTTVHIKAEERTKWNGKLDATAYTAADVLAKLKTVDGSGSGLDADLLDGKHAGINNGNVAIFVSFPSWTPLVNNGYLESNYADLKHPDELYFKALCKWAIATYPGGGNFIGAVSPNSAGYCHIHLYNAGTGSDGNGGTEGGAEATLPRYCSGVYYHLNGYQYSFGTCKGVWKWNNGSYMGNAATATTANKLSTTAKYTAWGRTFFANGVPQGVNGNMTEVGSISGTSSAAPYLRQSGIPAAVGNLGPAVGFGMAASSYGLFIWGDGNGRGHIQVGRKDGTQTAYNLILQEFGGSVGIGTATPAAAYKLDVAGAVRVTSLRIGDATLSWDGEALKIDTGLYSTSFISARGKDNTTGAGGGIDEAQLEDYLTDNGYAKQSWVLGKGYLTSAQLLSYLTNNELY